jgi:hypothetical protein
MQDPSIKKLADLAAVIGNSCIKIGKFVLDL